LPDLHRAALQAVPAISSRQSLSFLLSPRGILRPKAFLAAAILVYAVGAASHVLTTPGVIATAGPWPFAAIQAVLIWLWFALHSKRLRDAGVGSGLTAGVAVLYALSVVLLVIVEASFASAISGQTGDAKAASGLELILLVSVIALLLSSAHYDSASAVVALLLAVEFIPIVLALAMTAWAASRPSREARAA
jgi:hypothetical protein